MHFYHIDRSPLPIIPPRCSSCTPSNHNLTFLSAPPLPLLSSPLHSTTLIRPSLHSPLFPSPSSTATKLTLSGFINYLFTTPLVVLSLSLLAGLAPSDTLVAVLATLGMVVTALLSALSPARWHSGERARWGWFAFSCVGFVAVWCTLFSAGLKGGSDLSA